MATARALAGQIGRDKFAHRFPQLFPSPLPRGRPSTRGYAAHLNMPEPSSDRGSYRGHLERLPKIGSTAAGEHDLEILAEIHEHRFLTQALLLSLFPPSAARTPIKAIAAAAAKRGATLSGKHTGSNLHRRLRALFDAGLTDRIPRGLGLPYAYSLTPAGQRFLVKAGRLDRMRPLAKPGRLLFHVEHTLMVALFRIAVELAVRERPSFEILASEREGQPLRHSWRHRGRSFGLNPDGFLVLRDRSAPEGRNTRACFLECDRDTMTHARLLAKYEAYRALERSGELLARFSVANAVVATVANTSTRASALLNLAADNRTVDFQDYRDRLLFTAEDAYRDHPQNVFAQIWRRADKPMERSALIGSPLPIG